MPGSSRYGRYDLLEVHDCDGDRGSDFLEIRRLDGYRREAPRDAAQRVQPDTHAVVTAGIPIVGIPIVHGTQIDAKVTQVRRHEVPARGRDSISPRLHLGAAPPGDGFEARRGLTGYRTRGCTDAADQVNHRGRDHVVHQRFPQSSLEPIALHVSVCQRRSEAITRTQEAPVNKTRRRQSNCPCLYGNKNKLTSRVARHLHLRASPVRRSSRGVTWRVRRA